MINFLYIAKGQKLPNFRSVFWLQNILTFTFANVHGQKCMHKLDQTHT